MESPPPRLDGWKSIAAYLGRDERTAQRWRERGLPVHAVPGGKRGTVFAFTAEIDEWLRQQPPGGHPENGHGHDDAPIPPASSPDGPHSDPGAPSNGLVNSGEPATAATTPNRPVGVGRHRWVAGAAVLALAAALAAVVAFRTANGSSANSPSRIVRAEVAPGGLTAWTADGTVAFSVPPSELLPSDIAAKSSPNIGSEKVPLVDDLDGDGTNEVIVTLWFHLGERVATDEVRCYSSTGTLRWRYRPERRLEFGERTFEGPWAVRDRLVVPDGDGRRRLLLAVIHDVWWPSFVVSLDADGSERLHLVHSGHLYELQQVRAPAGDLVMATGVNNEYESAALMGVDLLGPPVLSPQMDPDYSCVGCDGRALAVTRAPYLLLPQSELSRLTGRPYNLGQRLSVTAAGIQLRVQEAPGDGPFGALYSHYRLSPGLEPVATWVSDGYWTAHRQLEARGNLKHSAEDCPERTGQRVRIWTGTTWREAWVPSEGAPN